MGDVRQALQSVYIIERMTDPRLAYRFSSMDIRRTGQLGNKEVQELLSRDSRWKITPREDCVKMVSLATGVKDYGCRVTKLAMLILAFAE